MVIFPEHRVEAFILGQDEARHVCLVCAVAKRSTLDAIGPTAFCEVEMLDQATKA